MKTKIIPIKQPERFQPFSVVLEIDTLDEARVIWHMLNMSSRALHDSITSNSCAKPSSATNTGLWAEAWEAVDAHMTSINAK